MLPQAVLAVAWLVHEPLDHILDGPKDTLWAGWSNPVCWTLILWFSLSGHALRGFLINKGQVCTKPFIALIKRDAICIELAERPFQPPEDICCLLLTT